MNVTVEPQEIKTPGFCALCKSRCGSTLVTKGGRFIRQEPLPEHPTGQALCIKGKAAAELIYSPQRQLYPLKRTRPKGDANPGWERISWEEALTITARELGRIRSQHGPEAVVFGWTTPSGTPISDNIGWIERFTNAFGSPNIAYGTEICNWHKDFAHAYTYGRSIASPDFEKSRCVVLWGHNPSATWLDHATATASARAGGAKLIVVDPRRAGFASRADQWLRVRPGADGLLALGIAGEMIRNGWYDRDFMADWSNGPLLVRADTQRLLRASDLADAIDSRSGDDLVALSAAGRLFGYDKTSREYALSERPELEASRNVRLKSGETVFCQSAFTLYRALCDEYPPERVEELAWVSASQITETARILHENAPVSYYWWSGVGQHTNATQTDRAMSLLMALTGSFDAPGGNVDFSRPPAAKITGGEFLSPEQRAKCISLKRSTLGPGQNGWVGSDAVYDAILSGDPYQVHGMFGFGRNFLVNHANGSRGAQALAQLEFYVHCDVMMTPTATFADIFLPINTPWERDALRVGFEGSQRAENLIQLRQAAIPSEGESQSDAFVVFELAKRLGFGDLFWDGDIEEGFRAILAPLEISPEELRQKPVGISVEGEPHYYRYKRDGFKTQTGKIEVFSEVFQDAGQSPLPIFVEPALSPYSQPDSEFPLVLTSAKVVHYCHGQHRNAPSLRKRSPDPEVTLHPDTASERGIAEGDWVALRSPSGEVRMRAKFDKDLDSRVVSAQYGWWQSNEIMSLPSYDPFSSKGSNYNLLISDKVTDPVSGSTGLRSSLCEIVSLDASTAWSGWRSFRVERIETETHDIRSLYFEPLDSKPLPPFRGGQHLTLRFNDKNGETLVRCYTISQPTDGSAYRISVKLVRHSDGRNGAVSSLVHSLDVGSHILVDLRAPKGDFHLKETEESKSGRPVFVAAGIGITPILAMLHDLCSTNPKSHASFIYGIRSEVDFAFKDEIARLEARMPRLKTAFYLSSPNPETEEKFERGRITPDAILQYYEPGSNIYLCGPTSMVQDIFEGLIQAGVPTGNILMEAFGPSARTAAPAPTGPQAVHLMKSGVTIEYVPGTGSLLDQIEKAGVKAASGCRTGQCESCSVRLLGGEAAYPGGVHPPEGACLPCVAVPMTKVLLDL